MANTSFIITAHSQKANTTVSNTHPTEASTSKGFPGFPSPASFASVADAQNNANTYAMFLNTIDYEDGYDWKGKASHHA